MKKFFASFFILLIFSLIVFWIGWTQIKIPPKSCGIVVSKTHGISEKPVINGEFSWYWQFLLPTNAQIVSFRTEPPYNFTKTFTTSLPSSDIIKKAFGEDSSFTYSFNFEISLYVTPENLVALYKDNKISDSESLSKYLDGAATYITQLASAYYIKKAEENSNFRPENIRREDLIRSVQPYIDYPEIEVLTVSLSSYTLADSKLYQSLKEKLESESFTFEIDSSNINQNYTGDQNE